MKKIRTLALVVMMAFTFAACGNNQNAGAGSQNEAAVSSAERAPPVTVVKASLLLWSQQEWRTGG